MHSNFCATAPLTIWEVFNHFHLSNIVWLLKLWMGTGSALVDCSSKLMMKNWHVLFWAALIQYPGLPWINFHAENRRGGKLAFRTEPSCPFQDRNESYLICQNKLEMVLALGVGWGYSFASDMFLLIISDWICLMVSQTMELNWKTESLGDLLLMFFGAL